MIEEKSSYNRDYAGEYKAKREIKLKDKNDYSECMTQEEIDSIPMIEICPLTNMFKSNPNVKRRNSK